MDQGSSLRRQWRRSRGRDRDLDDPSRFAVLDEGCPEQEHTDGQDRAQDHQTEELGGVVPVPGPIATRHPGEPSIQPVDGAHDGSLQSVRATDAIRREETPHLLSPIQWARPGAKRRL